MSAVNEGVIARLRKLVEDMNIEEDRFITDIIIIMKTTNAESGLVGIVYNYDTKDWIIRTGMLSVAAQLEDSHEKVSVDGDDDDD
jgi:hypothetical protein